ncbi:MAG: hypothetical protein ACP5LV_05945, partial [Thermoplasmata archaeon]
MVNVLLDINKKMINRAIETAIFFFILPPQQALIISFIMFHQAIKFPFTFTVKSYIVNDPFNTTIE